MPTQGVYNSYTRRRTFDTMVLAFQAESHLRGNNPLMKALELPVSMHIVIIGNSCILTTVIRASEW
jgi:hypothetical protein